MIGGRTKKDIPLYLTGPRPEVAKKLGFWGSKVALPHGPPDGHEGIRKNVEYLKACKEAVGPDYPVQVDCYMSLDVPYTIALVKVRLSSPPSTPPFQLELMKTLQACEKAGVEINWWEEVLHPDDFDGHVKLKEALPYVKFTTGEHEYSKYVHSFDPSSFLVFFALDVVLQLLTFSSLIDMVSENSLKTELSTSSNPT